MFDSGAEETDGGKETHNPSPKILNARARGQALIDLSKSYPGDYRRFYLIRKREIYENAGVPLSRRHVKHQDDGTGFCGACDEPSPCAVQLERRRKRNGK